MLSFISITIPPGLPWCKGGSPGETDLLTIDADALARSYNRWMADIWKNDKTWLRWVCVPPRRSVTFSTPTPAPFMA